MAQSSEEKTRENKRRICVIFPPQLVTDSTTTRISTLQLLRPLAKELYVITGNFPVAELEGSGIHIINIHIHQADELRPPLWRSIPRFLLMQMKIGYHLLKMARKYDVVFLGGGAQAMLIPSILTKIIGKKLVFSHLGQGTASRGDYKVLYQKTLFGTGKYIFPCAIELLEKVNFTLADRIAFFNRNVDRKLTGKPDRKVFRGVSRFYVDTDKFRVERKLDERKYLVGFIGRFDKMKGLTNIAQALSSIVSEYPEAEFILGGDGPLRGEIVKALETGGITKKVTLPGWISHDELPRSLNDIKLLVIASYGETGPHMLFEAMACGTPVLATPVGIIPDVIDDGETGFIMADNNHGTISENIKRALNNPDLMTISKNARKLIEAEYTHRAAVERYGRVFSSLE